MIDTYKLEVTLEEKKQIAVLANRLAEAKLDFQKCSLERGALEMSAQMLGEIAFTKKIRSRANECLYMHAKGFMVIDFGNDNFFDEHFKEKLTLVLSSILRPFGIFKKAGIWRAIDVDLSKEKNRSRGAGYNPFHIDFVNSEFPPHFSILVCVREDPFGGGHTIVSNFLSVLGELSQLEYKSLFESTFYEGQFFDLENIGREVNPFPILQKLSDKEMILRFTSKISTLDTMQYLISKIEKLLIEKQISFLLEKNQVVIFNQRLVCHGRLPLNGNQDSISQMKRRLLFQTFGGVYEG